MCWICVRNVLDIGAGHPRGCVGYKWNVLDQKTQGTCMCWLPCVNNVLEMCWIRFTDALEMCWDVLDPRKFLAPDLAVLPLCSLPQHL